MGGYALWFVPVLILVKIGFYPLSEIRLSVMCFVLLVCMVLSYVSSVKIGLVSNNALLTFCGLWFYGIGNICRPLFHFVAKFGLRRIISLCMIGFLFSLLYIPICSVFPAWFINKIPSPIYYITPLFATCGIFGISLLLEKYASRYIVNILSKCGRYSLIILAFHQIICMIAQQYVSSKFAILITIIFLSFLVWFIPKYLPCTLGKSISR